MCLSGTRPCIDLMCFTTGIYTAVPVTHLNICDNLLPLYSVRVINNDREGALLVDRYISTVSVWLGFAMDLLYCRGHATKERQTSPSSWCVRHVRLDHWLTLGLERLHVCWMGVDKIVKAGGSVCLVNTPNQPTDQEGDREVKLLWSALVSLISLVSCPACLLRSA